jgi:hypothetical protein
MDQSERILGEIERQKRYEEQLGNDFTYPLFNSKRALESQRQSGYRNTAAACREIVDNAIEAGATKIHMVMNRPTQKAARQRKDAVESIAFIDNGSGMRPKIARFALSWGGGTHFDDAEFIGKFGFGLPNASINQCRRVEVYTRTAGDQPFAKVALDIDEYSGEGTLQQIKPHVESSLPDFVQRYLEKEKWTLSHGTVVVWTRLDKISYSTVGSLREHIVDDFGATYRYLLEGLELLVDGKHVEKLDPLFLEKDARYYVSPEHGGAIKIDNGPIVVRLVTNAESGDQELLKISQPEELADPSNLATGVIHVRVARFPLGLVVGKETDPITPLDKFAGKRFEIRKSRRGMSFVRAGREIETVDAFPRRQSDKASGLGDWPLLQSYAYHWAIEVRFTPALDGVFGITHDKQTVRPIESFWRLLTSEAYDELLTRENSWQEQARKTARKQHFTSRRLKPSPDLPSPAELAAQSADASIGQSSSVPEYAKPEANLNFEKEAQERAKTENRPVEETRRALNEQQSRKKFSVDYADDPNGPFYTPEWVGRQLLVRINKSHPFFAALYAPLVELEGGRVAKEAVDLTLIALARGELITKNEDTREFYRAQRVHVWSPFLDTAMRGLARGFPDVEEDAA